NTPRAGASLVVLSSGAAAAPGQTNPYFVTFQSDEVGTSSTVPADWLALNGGQVPNSPGCPHPAGGTVDDPTMLTLRLRVPQTAKSFSVDVDFLSSEFPEWVCSPYNDFFVALLDSGFSGSPPNPADKNLATITASHYPIGVNMAYGNTGLFTQCVNGTVGCQSGTFGTITTCTGTSGLVATGMDVADYGCGASGGMVGGGTGWMVMRGNVVGGEV